jgi:tetratricopeptide (TPR) repeat protein
MRYLIILVFSLVMFTPGISQEITDPQELFSDGQDFFQREDYKEALYYFRQLCEKYPNQANFNFKAGECYLNIPGLEYLAVPYFEKAIQKIVPKKEYNKNDFEEQNAPLHAYFYLGNAYRMAGKLEDALKAYTTFFESPYFPGNYNQNVVEAEIASCERAKIIQDSPIKITRNSIGDKINTAYSEFYAVKSGDGKKLVFVRGLKFYDAVFESKLIDGQWSDPVNINQDILSDGDFYPTGLNSDGTILLLTRSVDENSDIYISFFRNTQWTKAQKIPGKINALANETFASFSNDDKTIYFVSNKSGGKGGKDIYFSKMLPDSTWDKPKNIGKVINTAEDEESPVVCNNGNTLFFSSKGHYNMGGYDIFYSTRQSNKWSVPRNIGYPINSTRDDLFYITDNSCLSALISIVDPLTGYSDIYTVKINEALAIP